MLGVSSDFVSRFGRSLELSPAELAELHQAAAHDRVMREVLRNLDPSSVDVLGEVMDALRVLDRERWPGLSRLMRRLARQSLELEALLPIGNESMSR